MQRTLTVPRRSFLLLALVLLAEIVGGCGRRSEETTSRSIPTSNGFSRPADSAAPPNVAASTRAAPTEQRLPLRDGRTVIVDSDDHVVILAADGGVGSDSWCGTYGISYRRAVVFLSEVIRLVEAADKHALVELIGFPLRASVPVKSRADFLRRYDQILPPSEVAAISRADPAAIFCRDGAFMLGDGEIWAAPDETGAYRVRTINPAVLKPRH